MALVTASGGLSNGKLALATADTEDVLAGKTYYAGDKEIKTGTMINRGAWSATVNPTKSVAIPQGYHNGNGKVTANKAHITLYANYYAPKAAQLNYSVTIPSGSTYQAFMIIVSGHPEGMNLINTPTVSSGTLSGRYTLDANSGEFYTNHGYYWFLNDPAFPCTIKCTTSGWHWSYTVKIIAVY